MVEMADDNGKSGAGMSGFWLFVVLSLLGIFYIYQNALWNRTLLAPLDIGPNLYPEWKWMDPRATGVPKNHYIVDIFDFELPRQYGFYNGLRSGEFPWWLPQIEGGCPFFAEAYISGTDPIRLALYRFCSFETAYNLVRPIQCFLLGLGMFVLLKHLRFKVWIAVFGSLSFQFATSHALFFYPTHLQATFLYYTFLWALWNSWLKRPRWAKFFLAVITCAAIFGAGNQQSAAYLPIFALCFCFGYGWFSIQQWKKVLFLTVGSGLSGALLVAPLLIPEFELFLLSVREIVPYRLTTSLTGPLSLSFIFPWVLGTFRTLDLSKISDQLGVGFALYPGTAAALLAIWGCIKGFKKKENDPVLRTGISLIVVYFVICSTPLVDWLYVRSSALGVIGLIICAASAL